MIEISEDLTRHAVGVLNEQKHRGHENWEYDEPRDDVRAVDQRVRRDPGHELKVESNTHILSPFEAIACALLYSVDLGAAVILQSRTQEEEGS